MVLGGAQEHTLLLARGLQERGHDVLLGTGPETGREGSLHERVRRENIPMQILPSLRRDIHPVYDVRAFPETGRAISQFSPDIVHTHSSKAGVVGRLMAYQSGVPRIVHTIQGLPFHPYQPNWLFHVYSGIERGAASVCDRLVPVAEAMRDQALEADVGYPEQYEVVYAGFEIEKFAPENNSPERVRDQFDLPAGDRVITKIARLTRLKGHRFLAEGLAPIMKKEPDLRLLLVGDGPDREEIQQQVYEHLPRERVRFTGHISLDWIPEVLSASDLLVHTSLREGLPHVLPQALLSEVPVVSFDLDGCPEVVIDGETGWLVEAENVEQLRETLWTVLENPTEAEQRARRGRQFCEHRFSSRKMVDDTLEVYRSLPS